PRSPGLRLAAARAAHCRGKLYETVPIRSGPDLRRRMAERADDGRDLHGRLDVGRLEDVDVIGRPEHNEALLPLDPRAVLADLLHDFVAEAFERARGLKRLVAQPGEHDD